jgi:unsaturated chondroitin disaccharide hydrolase
MRLERAFTILDPLLRPEFIANETHGWEGILKHGVYRECKGLGVNESVVWGEYFFLSALEKALADLEIGTTAISSTTPQPNSKPK